MEETANAFEAEKSPFIDIPKIFYSTLTDKPIECCVTCDRNLLYGNEPYIVEKAFRHYKDFGITNTIFEYTMCIPCAQKMHSKMSKESLQKIQNHFSNLDLVERSAKLKKEYGNDFDKWISNCVMTNTPRSESEEYQICAQCIGNQLVFDLLPYMLSHEASDELTSLLSAQTLEEYNRFVDDNFGLPPQFKKALKDRPVLVS